MLIPIMKLYEISEQVQFNDLFQNPDMKETIALCKEISKSTPVNNEGKFRGFCSVCNKKVDFSYDWLYSYLEEKMINFREHLVCPICGLNNRQRGMAGIILQNIDVKLKRKNIFFFEQVTPFYNTMINFIGDSHNIIGGEFLGYNISSGKFINGIRNENALDLSFKADSLDMVISNDVFEHVPDINAALSEAHRVLSRGGKLIFSIPFLFTETTKTRAKLVDGKIEFLEEAIYHGNPVSSEGSLVFYDFGWDIISMCKNVGFSSVNMLAYFSIGLGHLGYAPLFVFMAIK